MFKLCRLTPRVLSQLTSVTQLTRTAPIGICTHINCGKQCCGRIIQKRNFHASTRHLKERDPYTVLGVPKNATKEDIKKKFKEMAKKYHPDINKAPDAKEKFAELNGAYQILVDDKKREMYDMTGSTDAAEGGNAGYGGPFGGGMSREQAEEIFNQFFGGGGPFGGSYSSAFGKDPFGGGARESPDAPRHGSDVRQVLNVSLKEAVYGAKKDIRVQKATSCTGCSGTGENPKKKSTTCSACNGKGEVEQRQAFFVVRTTCGKCGGSGKTTHSCPTCGGSGYQKEMKTLEVTVNAGVDNGSLLRVKGYGEPGYRGGTPGDVYLEIVVGKDPIFRRKGQDLEMDVTIPMHQAVLGGTAHITHLNGENLTVTIPPGSQYNDRVVVNGKGVPHKAAAKNGNLNVFIKIQIPRNLTSSQKKAMEEFARTQ